MAENRRCADSLDKAKDLSMRYVLMSLPIGVVLSADAVRMDAIYVGDGHTGELYELNLFVLLAELVN